MRAVDVHLAGSKSPNSKYRIMKNIVVSSPQPHPHTAPRLHHVTLNTGHVALHELNGRHCVSACEFLPLLQQPVGEIPGMPGFAFSVAETTQCCQFILTHQGLELITGGVAWGPGAGDSLWRWLGDYYDCIVPWVPGWRASCPRTPPPLPWLGVVLNLNLGLISKEHARNLAAVERDLALALIQRSLTRN
jgi:hypothetical protein